jgi:hypothetical protein
LNLHGRRQWKLILAIDDGHEGKNILLQVVLALGSPRRLASRLDGSQRK